MRLLFITCLCLIGSFTFSQKIGHLNTVAFIDTLTEAKIMADKIADYEKALTAQGEQMAMKFQKNVEMFQKDVQSGALTPIQQQSKQTELETEQAALGNYQKSAQESLLKRRDELLKPLLDRINKALIEIGKEDGYQFIFDSSIGLLYFPESDNVSAKLSQKLAKG
ncbi:MAG: OmpH family outer membrane protein [Saprospiraceae bacterium]|nr:OmpH family outer membrane protein [Saprospiraceae bacterium]